MLGKRSSTAIRWLPLLSAFTCCGCCQFLHVYGDLNPRTAISIELGNGNALAWLLIVSLAVLVSFALACHVRLKSWLQVVVLAISFCGILLIATTPNNSSVHLLSCLPLRF